MSAYNRLKHNTAWTVARDLLETIATALRPEEHQNAFNEFYRICYTAMDAYEAQVLRQPVRPEPSMN